MVIKMAMSGLTFTCFPTISTVMGLAFTEAGVGEGGETDKTVKRRLVFKKSGSNEEGVTHQRLGPSPSRLPVWSVSAD